MDTPYQFYIDLLVQSPAFKSLVSQLNRLEDRFNQLEQELTWPSEKENASQSSDPESEESFEPEDDSESEL